MFDTVITVVGNALTMPEWRRLERTDALVANFKIASTSRRYDRTNNRWIDGDSLRLRVTCWRRLAEGVVASIKVGDPVIVTGRLYTREWTTEAGERRTIYELEAVSVGHDLARGIGRFKRVRANLSTSVVEDAAADTHVAGEPSESVPELNQRSAALAAEMEDDGFFDDTTVELKPAAAPTFDVPGAADVDDPFADASPTLAGEVGGEPEPSGGVEDAGVAASGEAPRGRRGRTRVPAGV